MRDGVRCACFNPPCSHVSFKAWRARSSLARALDLSERRPGSHAGNHDLPVHDFHRALNQDASCDAVQAIAYLAGFFGEVAFTFENDALAVLELGHALAKATPFWRRFHRVHL
jgi:hypothetical protein